MEIKLYVYNNADDDTLRLATYMATTIYFYNKILKAQCNINKRFFLILLLCL